MLPEEAATWYLVESCTVHVGLFALQRLCGLLHRVCGIGCAGYVLCYAGYVGSGHAVHAMSSNNRE